jgi:hypothetical protein
VRTKRKFDVAKNPRNGEALLRTLRHGDPPQAANIFTIELKTPRMETAMLLKTIHDQLARPVLSRVRQVGKGVALAGAVAAATMSIAPGAAYAGNGTGAAIGLGILGGVIAGAAIASATQPVYGAPAPAYDYPPQPYQGYYNYGPAPTYYQTTQPYYGWSPYYR